MILSRGTKQKKASTRTDRPIDSTTARAAGTRRASSRLRGRGPLHLGRSPLLGPARGALPARALGAGLLQPGPVQRGLPAVRAPLELYIAHEDGVALLHARANQRLLRARFLQGALKALKRLVVGEVGHRGEALQPPPARCTPGESRPARW